MNTGTQKQTEEQGFENQTASGESANNQTNSETTSQTDLTELKYRDVGNVGTAKFAKGLGLFSIALGLAEVIAPAQMGELIGVSPRFRTILPAFGLREIASGLGILMQAKPTESVWSRVAGDAIDLAYLGAAFAGEENNKKRLTGAAIAVLGVTALDILCAQQLSSQEWSDFDGNVLAPTTVGQASARQSM
ncbi:MAG TPA: hypothetical protein VGC76_13805 [Pyrinomonadaceae bacterium]